MTSFDFDRIMRAAAEAKKTLALHGFAMPVLNEIPTLVAEVKRLEAALVAARDAVFKEGLARIEAEKQLAVEKTACDGYRSDHRAESGSESNECFGEDFVVAAYDTRCPKCREHDARRAVETKGPK